MGYPYQGERVALSVRLPVDLAAWLAATAEGRIGCRQNDLVVRALRLMREMTDRGRADTMGMVISSALDDVSLDIDGLLPSVTPEWRRPHRKTG